jgi:hypothetical protein
VFAAGCDKKRQLPVSYGGKFRQISRAIATTCGKFIAAFSRFLPPRFALSFPLTISLGDGV